MRGWGQILLNADQITITKKIYLYIYFFFQILKNSKNKLRDTSTKGRMIVRTAWDILSNVNAEYISFPTGCSRLDEMLEGGVLTGDVTELVGPSGAGKTQLCMQICTVVTSVTDASALYIDTCSSFSVPRVLEIRENLANTRRYVSHRTT